MLFIGLLIGCFVGVFIGVASMCFCFVAKTNDEYVQKYQKDMECELNDINC